VNKRPEFVVFSDPKLAVF